MPKWGLSKSEYFFDKEKNVVAKGLISIIKAVHMEDLSDLLKVRNFVDVMGYVGYVSGKDEDRRKLYVLDVYPLIRRKDNKELNDMAKAIVCNKCGKTLDLWDTQEDFTIERDLGYGTKYDGDKLDIHLCCDCMEKLIDECNITPISDNT